MLKSDVMRHFGRNGQPANENQLAKALGFSRQYVNQWGHRVPKSVAMKLHIRTGGVLEFRESDYDSAAA